MAETRYKSYFVYTQGGIFVVHLDLNDFSSSTVGSMVGSVDKVNDKLWFRPYQYSSIKDINGRELTIVDPQNEPLTALCVNFDLNYTGEVALFYSEEKAETDGNLIILEKFVTPANAVRGWLVLQYQTSGKDRLLSKPILISDKDLTKSLVQHRKVDASGNVISNVMNAKVTFKDIDMVIISSYPNHLIPVTVIPNKVTKKKPEVVNQTEVASQPAKRIKSSVLDSPRVAERYGKLVRIVDTVCQRVYVDRDFPVLKQARITDDDDLFATCISQHRWLYAVENAPVFTRLLVGYLRSEPRSIPTGFLSTLKDLYENGVELKPQWVDVYYAAGNCSFLAELKPAAPEVFGSETLQPSTTSVAGLMTDPDWGTPKSAFDFACDSMVQRMLMTGGETDGKKKNKKA